MNNILFNRTLPRDDKREIAAIIGVMVTQEENGFVTWTRFENADGGDVEFRAWHEKWDRDGAIESAVRQWISISPASAKLDVKA